MSKTTLTLITSDGQKATTTLEDMKRLTDVMVARIDKDKYSLAPEVEEVARELIRSTDRFRHLVDARIAFVFRNTKRMDEWTSKGDIVMGRAYVNDERQRFLSGIDLQVVINRRVWELSSPKQREALVAHELCHFELREPDKYGNPRWGLVNHDLEEFTYIVRKYGVWDESLRRFMAAYQDGETERQQMTMFDDESETP